MKKDSENPKGKDSKYLKTEETVFDRKNIKNKEKRVDVNDVSNTTQLNEVMPDQSDFNNTQLTLFQNFFPTEKNDDNKSTTFEFFDTSPRFPINERKQSLIRKENNGILPVATIPFVYHQNEYQLKIHPAIVAVKDKNTGEMVNKWFYPSGNEELVEVVLRKFAGIQNSGFHSHKKRTGVVFSLNQVRQELRVRKHAMTYDQIVLSLNILSLAFIEYNAMSKQNPKAFNRSPYFPVIGSVSRDNYNSDPSARWYVEFHRLITDGIDNLEYRQLAYDALMAYKSQLGRWVHRWLTNKFTAASRLNSFDIYFHTIKVHSKLLDNISLERQQIQACNEVMDELVTNGVASKYKKTVTRGKYNKVEKVLYTIYPSSRFITETKAANARKREHLKALSAAEAKRLKKLS